MFNSASLVGRQVFMVFAGEQLEKEFVKIGAYSETEGTKVMGLDDHGIWCENPNYEMGEHRTEKGVEKIVESMVYFVPWHYLLTVVIFPGRKSLKDIDFIGFKRHTGKK